MTYKNIFFLLAIFSSSLICQAASRSLRHALEAFDTEYATDPSYTGFKVSPHYTTATASHPSKHAYIGALTRQFHLYKLSLGGGGGEAPATPTEIAAMKSNALVAVRDAIDQWLSYLEPKTGVASSFWNDILLNPANRRGEMGEVLTDILEFVPTDHPPYSTTVRTALENLKKDVTEPEGYATRIANADLTFSTIQARIDTVKDSLPTTFTDMGTSSTSRGVYDALHRVLITPRTFSLADLEQSIAWARQRIDWLEGRITYLSSEVARLGGGLPILSPPPEVVLTGTPAGAVLASLGIATASTNPVVDIITPLTEKIIAVKGALDGSITTAVAYIED